MRSASVMYPVAATNWANRSFVTSLASIQKLSSVTSWTGASSAKPSLLPMRNVPPRTRTMPALSGSPAVGGSFFAAGTWLVLAQPAAASPSSRTTSASRLRFIGVTCGLAQAYRGRPLEGSGSRAGSPHSRNCLRPRLDRAYDASVPFGARGGGQRCLGYLMLDPSFNQAASVKAHRICWNQPSRRRGCRRRCAGSTFRFSDERAFQHEGPE